MKRAAASPFWCFDLSGWTQRLALHESHATGQPFWCMCSSQDRCMAAITAAGTGARVQPWGRCTVTGTLLWRWFQLLCRCCKARYRLSIRYCQTDEGWCCCSGWQMGKRFQVARSVRSNARGPARQCQKRQRPQRTPRPPRSEPLSGRLAGCSSALRALPPWQFLGTACISAHCDAMHPVLIHVQL